MNCNRCDSLLSAYLDGELSGREMLQVREHVHSCAHCQAELDELRELKSLLSSLPKGDPRPEFEDQLIARVLGTAPVSPRRHRRWIATGAAAACVAALAMAFWSAQPKAPAGSEDVIAERFQTMIVEEQALTAASDPLAGQPPVVTVSYGQR